MLTRIVEEAVDEAVDETHGETGALAWRAGLSDVGRELLSAGGEVDGVHKVAVTLQRQQQRPIVPLRLATGAKAGPEVPLHLGWDSSDSVESEYEFEDDDTAATPQPARFEDDDDAVILQPARSAADWRAASTSLLAVSRAYVWTVRDAAQTTEGAKMGRRMEEQLFEAQRARWRAEANIAVHTSQDVHGLDLAVAEMGDAARQDMSRLEDMHDAQLAAEASEAADHLNSQPWWEPKSRESASSSAIMQLPSGWQHARSLADGEQHKAPGGGIHNSSWLSDQAAITGVTDPACYGCPNLSNGKRHEAGAEATVHDVVVASEWQADVHVDDLASAISIGATVRAAAALRQADASSAASERPPFRTERQAVPEWQDVAPPFFKPAVHVNVGPFGGVGENGADGVGAEGGADLRAERADLISGPMGCHHAWRPPTPPRAARHPDVGRWAGGGLRTELGAPFHMSTSTIVHLRPANMEPTSHLMTSGSEPTEWPEVGHGLRTCSALIAKCPRLLRRVHLHRLRKLRAELAECRAAEAEARQRGDVQLAQRVWEEATARVDGETKLRSLEWRARTAARFVAATDVVLLEGARVRDSECAALVRDSCGRRSPATFRV
jgi:hypothetical protein